MLVEGTKVLFRIGIALFQFHQSQLLKQQEFGPCFNIVANMGNQWIDVEQLIKVKKEFEFFMILLFVLFSICVM